MSEALFKHALTDGDVVIFPNMVFGVMWAPTANAVVILGPNVPVKGTMEEVLAKLKEAKGGN
jgi:hypothetical protein